MKTYPPCLATVGTDRTSYTVQIGRNTANRRSERPVITLWCSLLDGSGLKMDESTSGEDPKRAFSGIKKLRQSRSEAFSSENFAFFSVLALFLRVLVAKSCVFMAFLGKKIRPQRSLESGLLCGFLREMERLKKRGARGRKVEERRGLEKGGEGVWRLKREKWRRYAGLCFESRE